MKRTVRKRVPMEAVEDVVQEALTVVHTKGAGAAENEIPPLPWCFQVLRNVVGNYYQKQRTRDAAALPGSSSRAEMEEITGGRPGPTPLEALERSETARLLRAAVHELATLDEHCGSLLRSLLEETPQRAQPAGASSTSYVRAFRFGRSGLRDDDHGHFARRGARIAARSARRFGLARRPAPRRGGRSALIDLAASPSSAMTRSSCATAPPSPETA